jgi:hypothetical protein
MALILPDLNGSKGIWGAILNDALNGLDQRVISNTAVSTGNTQAIALLDGRVTTNSNNITTHAADISGLDTRIDGHDTAISTLTGRVNGHDTSLVDHDNRIDTLEAAAGGGGTAPTLYSTILDVTCTQGDLVGVGTVTWPPGLFTSAPVVVTTIASQAVANERLRYISRVNTLSTADAWIEIARGDGGNFTATNPVSVCIIAHQM